MMTRLRESGLDGMKATVQYCSECCKKTVHYSAPGGWPVCNACGYNPELEKLADVIEQRRMMQPKMRWPWKW